MDYRASACQKENKGCREDRQKKKDEPGYQESAIRMVNSEKISLAFQKSTYIVPSHRMLFVYARMVQGGPALRLAGATWGWDDSSRSLPQLIQSRR